MNITRSEWRNYTKRLEQVNKKASDLLVSYLEKNGLEDRDALIRHAYGITQKYGNASASLNALMYDTIAELESIHLEAAELAPLPTYGDVAKAVNGTLKASQNFNEIAGAVSRLVKLTGEDTMLRNAERDRAEFAWIPEGGETCAYCIMLASNGWKPMSKEAYKNGHAEHIHSNCECTYMVRHSSNFNVKGYDPDKYRKMYDDAEGNGYKEKLNSMRREFYEENKEEINEQKRIAYGKRVELLNSSAAEETYIN